MSAGHHNWNREGNVYKRWCSLGSLEASSHHFRGPASRQTTRTACLRNIAQGSRYSSCIFFATDNRRKMFCRRSGSLPDRA